MMLLEMLFAVALRCACRHEPVSCKFIGAPGQRFTYAGKPYAVPESRSIEIITEQADQCRADPAAQHIASDKFGMWTMRLPEVQQRPESVHEVSAEQYRKLVAANTRYVECWTRYYSDGSYERFDGCNTVSCSNDGWCSMTVLACPNTACSATTTTKPPKTKP